MEPEDIEGRDFFVGLRGYDRDEVQQFLTEVASEHRVLLDEVEELRRRQGEPTPARDPFEDLGSSVTAILRTANESAGTITAEAEARAAELRRQADEEALRIRGEAEEAARQRMAELDAEAERLRVAAATADAEAERILEESHHHAAEIVERAHEEAGRILNEADGRVSALEADAEARGRQRAQDTVEEAVSRLAAANRHHEALRARLAETNDEIQLALMALGDPIADPRQAIDDAVRQVIVLDGAESVGHEG